RFHAQLELFDEPTVDDLARTRLVRVAIIADEKTRDLLERTLRRRESDALRSCLAEPVESLERQCEMRTALGARDRMNLVDDHRTHAAEHATPARAREHDVQRFRRRDQNVRRFPDHPSACGGRRVAGANRNANFWKRLSCRSEAIAQLVERLLEVAL